MFKKRDKNFVALLKVAIFALAYIANLGVTPVWALYGNYQTNKQF